jgi:hypothetical protein
MTSEYLSSDFSYKKYSLEQLDNWVNDALNCEDLTPQDIYDTVIKCVDESVEYHKKYLTKSIELLSLLKGNPPSDYIEHYETTPFSKASEKDWVDFWEGQEEYTKEQIREFEAKEREYERQRAMLDAQQNEIEKIRQQGGFEWTPESEHSKYYYDTDRNR